LKEKINGVFDALKAVKRINTENEDQANSVLLKQFHKRIEDLQSKLIYSDQWKFIFEELKKIQQELKDVPFRWNQKRNLYNAVNTIFDDLRKYRMTEVITKTKGRISQLNKILDGLKDSIARDHENYNMQVEKMQHYTRGKLPVEEIKSRFSYIFDRIKEKEIKADGIKQTIEQLKNDIEKEKKQQEEREQQRLKREQEQANKKQDAQQETEPAETANNETQSKTREPRKRKVKSADNKENPAEVTEIPKESEQESEVETTEDIQAETQPETTEEELSPNEPDAGKEAEKILVENNAEIEDVLEIEPATPESIKEETNIDAVDEEIARTTERANKFNPD
jgi:hypothetical protein